jgi:hypothetical protein
MVEGDIGYDAWFTAWLARVEARKASRPTLAEVGAAREKYGELPVLWWCDTHRWLSPLNVPCPLCRRAG